jgi:hypothetical protein
LPFLFLFFYSASIHPNIVQMETKNCKPCLREDTNVCAEYWCFDCDEPLCGTCLKNHKKSKFLLNHHTVDLDFIDIFPTSTLSSVSHCSKHGDGRFENSLEIFVLLWFVVSKLVKYYFLFKKKHYYLFFIHFC